MKSKCDCLAFTAKYISKTMDMMDLLLVIIINYKKCYRNNYLEKFFYRGIK